MANVEKLKAKAKQLEAKSNWKGAIEIWSRISNLQESGKEPNAIELSQYNRIGDLHLKAGDPAGASDFFERAADRYADSGFQNNAIALCNKVLRYAPGRVHIYLKLAKLMAQKGFVAEAKQHFLEYAERMQKAGRESEAIAALRELTSLAPNAEELQSLLDQYGMSASRTSQQALEIEPEYQVDEAEPRKRKTSSLVFLDVEGVETPVGRTPSKPDALGERSSDIDAVPDDPGLTAAAEPDAPLELETTSLAPEDDFGKSMGADSLADLESGVAPPVDDPELVTGLESHTTDFASTERESDNVEIINEDVELAPELTIGPEIDSADWQSADDVELTPEATAPRENELASEPSALPPSGLEPTRPTLDGLPLLDDPAELSEIDDVAANLTDALEVEPTAYEMPDLTESPTAPVAHEAPEVEAAAPVEEEAAEQVSVVEDVPVAAISPAIDILEEQILDNPDDPELHRSLGEALIEAGERERGIDELDLAIQRYEAQDNLSLARDVVDEILRVDPNSILHQQKLVEYAFRAGDRSQLVHAYLSLADALVRVGATSKASAVYERVLEHDAQNQRAQTAVSMLRATDEPRVDPKDAKLKVRDDAPAAGTDFVDLSAMVVDEKKRREDARMRVSDDEPTGDEERDFQDMLAQFRRGIDEHLGDEDFQAHYDLGVAFKEMGLLDDAIAEFQKALRASSVRLKTTEAIGVCFIEKEQYAVAEAILRRGLELPASGDDERVGVLYWLGRALESQQKTDAALGFYERVFAVDIRFADARERVKALAKAQS